MATHENLKFLPLFYTRRYENIGNSKKKEFQYDFCFVGTAHPKKYKFIQMMTRQLKEVYPNQFVYYFFPSRIVFFYRKLMNPEFAKSIEVKKPMNYVEKAVSKSIAKIIESFNDRADMIVI